MTIFSKIVTLIFDLDLDRLPWLGNKERVLLHSKAMAYVKVFDDKQTDKRTNRQTDKWMGKELYASDLKMEGIKTP